MQDFVLDTRLAADCYPLGSLGNAELLLMDNACFPWLILVPHSKHTEFFELSDGEQRGLLHSINTLSAFIKQHFASEKLNIATLGNIVSQLHIHIIGRHSQDACWPGVAWGTPHRKAYLSTEVAQIRSAIEQHAGAAFRSRSHLK